MVGQSKGRFPTLNRILKYGVAAGLIAGVALSAVVITWGDQPPIANGMVIGYTIMLVALSTIFVAIKRHRDLDRGGVIGFWRALGLGVGISAVAGVIYVIAWETSVWIAHLDFAGSYAQSIVDQARARGVSGEALAKLTAEMEAFKVQYANPLFRWPMTFAEIFPVGVLVSLVSAGLLCFSRFMPLPRNAEAAGASPAA